MAGSHPPLRLLGLSVVVAAFAAIPIIVIGKHVVDGGWAEFTRLVFRPLIGELLINTLSLCALVTGSCAVLGTALAWIVERSNLPFPAVWSALLTAPLAIPAFINSYAWITVFPRLDGLLASTIVTTLSYYPFVFLPVLAAVRRLDPALEESARALGLGPIRAFVRVVLPQLRVALLGGGLLVALHLLAEYGAIEQLRFPTFTTAIIAQYESTFASTAANLLAAVLIVCCLAFITIELVARGRRTAPVRSGAPGRTPRVHLGWFRVPVLLLLLALLALAIGIPTYSIVYWLDFGGTSAWYPSALFSALVSTLKLSALAAGVTIVAAFPVAWLAVRYRSPFSTVLERSTYLASSVPGVVVGLALVTASITYARPLYQTTPLIISAYLMLFLPRAMISLRAAISQAPPGLDEAARSLGRPPLAAFGRVTVPLMSPGIAAGAALVFLAVSTELTATLLLAPTGTNTLATQFWAASSEVDYPTAAPYALLLIVLSIPATFLLLHQARRASSA